MWESHNSDPRVFSNVWFINKGTGIISGFTIEHINANNRRPIGRKLLALESIR